MDTYRVVTCLVCKCRGVAANKPLCDRLPCQRQFELLGKVGEEIAQDFADARAHYIKDKKDKDKRDFMKNACRELQQSTTDALEKMNMRLMCEKKVSVGLAIEKRKRMTLDDDDTNVRTSKVARSPESKDTKVDPVDDTNVKTIKVARSPESKDTKVEPVGVEQSFVLQRLPEEDFDPTPESMETYGFSAWIWPRHAPIDPPIIKIGNGLMGTKKYDVEIETGRGNGSSEEEPYPGWEDDGVDEDDDDAGAKASEMAMGIAEGSGITWMYGP